MKIKCKILLVAKPWRGGLANYVFRALEMLYPGEVFWLESHPRTLAQKATFLMDRAAWDRNLVETINSSEYKAAIFINTRPSFVELIPRENNIVWLTDSPNLGADMLSRFGPIYVSDIGYADNVTAASQPGQFAGELGFACDPTIHKPVTSLSSRKKGICFVGNRDKKRDIYLDHLLRENVDTKIIGNYFFNSNLFWQHPSCFRPAVNFSRMGSIYSRHQLSLNIHAKVVLNGTNMRTFEAAGYNIAQLVEYRPGIERFFEPGKEIEVFSSPEELVEKGKRLLADSDHMTALADAAAKRTTEHTYVNRVKTMLAGVL
jgi:spore maturation protein CgeB